MTVAISATIPQLIRLIKVKSSREFSLRSYVLWTMTQMVTLMYVSSIGDILLTVASSLWVLYYTVMIVLILRYRQTGPQPVSVTVPDADNRQLVGSEV